MPQGSVQLISRTKIVWKAREDIDDIAELARALLEICLEAMSVTRERLDSLRTHLKTQPIPNN
jgi:hypothetical protein